MHEIIGNTTATPIPRSNWEQNDSAKADYIKNKPKLGTLSAKDEVVKTDLEQSVQESLEKADTAIQTELDPTVPDYVKDITTDDITNWNNKSTFSGAYKDLTGIPQEFKPSSHEHSYIPLSEKGQKEGVATLDNAGKVPSSQLPSYVDDVLEYNGKVNFPSSGETGKIYIDVSTNITYRWSGSVYTPIGSDLALGETSSTAYYGDKGKQAYDHSQITDANPHGITKGMLGVVETYSNDEPLLNNIGGILANNHPQGFDNVPITDLITELLYPYTAPVINSFSLSPAVGAKEMNVAITVNTATVKVTKKSKTLQSINLYKGSTLVESKTEGVGSGGTFTFAINETLDGSSDTSYKVTVVEAGSNGATITSGNQTYDFVYPYFYGVVPGGTTINSETILGFTKSIRAKGSHNYTYTTNNSCPVIAYPKSYEALKSIIDPNNFTQDWTRSTVTVNNNTIPNVDYYVYVGGAATATATYKFNY